MMTDPDTFASALVADQPDNEQQGHQPRMSHKALLAALMIFIYHQEPQFQRFYELLSLLIEMDGLISSWRRTYTIDAYR